MNWIANFEGDAPIMEHVCVECPWRRNSGSYPAGREGIFRIVDRKLPLPMACHMTQREMQAYFTTKDIHRCRGIEIFRANIGIKSELNPDKSIIYESKEEALNSWPVGNIDWEYTRKRYFSIYPNNHYMDEKGQHWVAGTLQNDQSCSQCHYEATKCLKKLEIFGITITNTKDWSLRLTVSLKRMVKQYLGVV